MYHVLAMGAYREDTTIYYYNYTEVISIRGSKILGDAPRIFLLHVDCVLRTLPGVLSLPPSPFANILDLLQDRTSLKQLLYTSGCALHIILCTDACRHISQTHTRTHRDRDARLDGCTHNVS